MSYEKLEALQQAIQDRTLTNTANSPFVPTAWLVDLLGEKEILEVLNEGAIEKDERLDIARALHKGGQKADQYVYQYRLDSRLPIELSVLADVLGLNKAREKREKREEQVKGEADGLDAELERLKKDEAECKRLCDDFESLQYIFLSPTFPQGPLHRQISHKIRLPFLDPGAAQPTGEGHFGKVFKETLPSERYNPDGNNRGMLVVRKELQSKGEGEYAQELRCLRLLRATHHPNLLTLYGSYTYDRKHNFLFPQAVGGDLHDLLKRPERPDELRHDADFYLALSGLASALEQMHCYYNDDLKLEMIGCHHDLKPENVLVDHGRFILADFGLSSMRESSDEGEMLAKDRDTYFCAPEAFNYATLERYRTGPPSDIWSLGCILVEVLTYMQGGLGAVQRFTEQRGVEITLGCISIYLKAFHDGQGGDNPGVQRHLDEMTKIARASKQAYKQPERTLKEDAVQLVRDMLAIRPPDRPDIAKVLLRLRILALCEAAEPVCEAMQASPYGERHLAFFLERRVFYEWLGKLYEVAKNTQMKTLPLLFPTDAAFAETYETLRQLGKTVQLLTEEAAELDVDAVPSPLFSPLRRLNEQLLTCLDEESRNNMRRWVELDVVRKAMNLPSSSRSTDSDALANEPLVTSGPHVDILRLVAAEQVSRRMQSLGRSSVRQLSTSEVHELKDEAHLERTFGPGTLTEGGKKDEAYLGRMFGLGTLTEEGGEKDAVPVVIELLPIDAAYANDKKSEQLISRIDNLLSLSRDVDVLATYRALRCAGVYIDNSALGIVYHYPSLANTSTGARPVVTTLAETLAAWPKVMDSKCRVIITVNARLRLARELATAVWTFHQIGWLHKNLSPYNVLFFRSSSEVAPGTIDRAAPIHRVSLTAPALIGFSHSRRSSTEDSLFSSKLYSSSDRHRAYHHPDYATSDVGAPSYRPAYDYYSLGLVLLEIGLWMSLHSVFSKLPDRHAARQKLLHSFVPLVAAAMGETYASAVNACLSGDLTNPGDERVDKVFSELVIAPLEGIRV